MCLAQHTTITLLVCLVAPIAWSEPATYESDLQSFFTQIDHNYPFWDLKQLRPHWETVKGVLSGRVMDCAEVCAFLGLVGEAIRALNDSHLGFAEMRVPAAPAPKEYYPGVAFMPGAGDTVLIMSAPPNLARQLPAGAVVLTIDAEPARAHLEAKAKAAWPNSGQSSPQRVRMFVYRMPLRGARGETHVLTFTVDGRESGCKLTCDSEVSGWPHVYNMPEGLERIGRSFMYTQLASGVGYMYLRRVDESVWQGIPQALEKHPNAKGWIVDLRGNGGGGYDDQLINQVKALPRPVAAIIDAGCISAGETLARDLVNDADARLFGTTTAGASSSKMTWSFPSGIASIRIPTRSRMGIDGKLIEFNGIAPHVELEAKPEDVRQGKNTEILAAEAWILAR